MWDYIFFVFAILVLIITSVSNNIIIKIFGIALFIILIIITHILLLVDEKKWQKQ
jgi:hypothetical protein